MINDLSTRNNPSYVAYILTAIGFFCAGAHYIILSIPDETGIIRAVTKTVPCIMLGLWVLYKRFPDTSGWLVTFALIFTAIGDFILEGDGENSFLLGLGANLIAHILYIIGFSVEFKKLKLWRATLPFIYITGLLIVLLPYTRGSMSMSIAVTIYSLAIAAMAWRALAVVGQSGKIHIDEVLGFFGASLFITCDTMIAVENFIAPIKNGCYWIMTSYWIGQWSIAYSIIVLYPGQKRESLLTT